MKLYFHYLKLMAFYEQSDLDNLDKETRNLKTAWTKCDENSLDFDFENITWVFLEFAETELKEIPDRRSDRHKKLLPQVQTLLKSNDLTQNNFIPIILLERAISKLVGV